MLRFAIAYATAGHLAPSTSLSSDRIEYSDTL
jgi:hypothetical protein